MNVIIGILIPFIGTIIGAALVFVMKKEISKKIEVIIYGFAAGVMMAALVWSLINWCFLFLHCRYAFRKEKNKK